MAVSLAVNVRNALDGLKVANNIQCWLDSNVGLYWLDINGQYRNFVATRAQNMRKYENMLSIHVPAIENPAELNKQRGRVDGAEMWSHAPNWLPDDSKWPPVTATKGSDMSKPVKKVVPELSVVGVQENDALQSVLVMFDLCKR